MRRKREAVHILLMLVSVILLLSNSVYGNELSKIKLNKNDFSEYSNQKNVIRKTVDSTLFILKSVYESKILQQGNSVIYSSPFSIEECR